MDHIFFEVLQIYFSEFHKKSKFGCVVCIIIVSKGFKEKNVVLQADMKCLLLLTVATVAANAGS